MVIRIVEGLAGAREATGVVVVIDVMRAFTTAAYAFAAGIREIELVATVEEALATPQSLRSNKAGSRRVARRAGM
jgi:2-phosphosulfolactate phosphatase